MEGQVAAKRAKDDKKAADKIEKRRLAMEAIRRSRTNQIELRKEKKAVRVKSDKEFAAQWRVQQKTIEEEEEEERIKMRKMHLGHQKYLRSQIKGKRVAKRKERRDMLEESKMTGAVDAEEDAKFEAYVRSTIDDWASAGKSINPLARSLLPNDELKATLL